MEAAGQDSAVPATLKDSLMARLDRLGDAREIAQIAAVIGRQFKLALLDAVGPRRGTDLETALTKLVAAEIVFPEGRGLEGGFNFKHALVRDAAYESLLLARRREWHERVAHALEERFPELTANEPELLAYHFGEARLASLACDYRMRAGDRALARSAYPEAVANFTAGLKLADALPESADRLRRQLDFLLKLGPALNIVRSLQSAEAEAVYRRASEISKRLGDGAASYKAKWGLWLNANLRRRTALARERAGELVALAQRSGDSDLLLEAYHCRWSTAFFSGDVAGCLKDADIGIQSYDMRRHRHLGHAFGGHDPGVCAHICRGNMLLLAGDQAGSNSSVERGIELAEALDQPNSVGYALHNSAMCRHLVGDREGTFAIASRLNTLAERFGLAPWRGGGRLLLAWATANGSGIADAARVVDAEMEKATATGPIPQYYMGLAAEILLAAGRSADGIVYLDRAIAAIDEPGIGFYLPEIYRLRGECLLAVDHANKDEAKRAFAAARDIANRQGAVIFERRAEASLAEIANLGTSR